MAKPKLRKQGKPKITPRGKQVLIRPVEEQGRVSEHGIFTPVKVEQERKAIGTVEAVGPDVKDIKKGDNVIYGAFAGEKIAFKESIDNIEYLLLFEEDILAFIEFKV